MIYRLLKKLEKAEQVGKARGMVDMGNQQLRLKIGEAGVEELAGVVRQLDENL